MSCECTQVSAKTEAERKTLRIALSLNAAMFVIGTVAGLLAQSTGLLADAVDMLVDATAYVLALMAISRGPTFKKNAARWSGGILILLGAGIVAEVVRRWFFGSEPAGLVMMVYSAVAFAVNLYVLNELVKFRRGDVHLRASYICTRADVVANVAVFISGGLVAATGLQIIDLIAGFAIGLYVLKEAVEILREANEAPETAQSSA
jgi:cation diffusion facilitator family transporter